jgi:hypothetical protein
MYSGSNWTTYRSTDGSSIKQTHGYSHKPALGQTDEPAHVPANGTTNYIIAIIFSEWTTLGWPND